MAAPGQPIPPSPTASSEVSLGIAAARVVALAIVAGYVEVLGFLDVGGIYPGIMTGNTVQIGLNLAREQWHRLALIGFAVGMFFVGGVISSVLKRHLRRPAVEFIFMAFVLIAAGFVRLHANARIPFELPLLALAMAMQGETLTAFGGVSIQTIVVTNNMVKFSDALVGRYFPGRAIQGKLTTRPALAEVLLPGLAWFFYSVAAAAGAVAVRYLRFPLLLPAVLLFLMAWHFLHHRPAESNVERSAETPADGLLNSRAGRE